MDVATITSVEITGKDSTGTAFRAVKSGLGEIDSASRALQNTFAALGVTLSVGAFAGAIKDAIDYADHLNDLSKSTGVAVETLGGLGYAASTAGINLETIAKSSQKLAQLMAEAAGGSEKAAHVFASMGVSIKNADGSLRGLDESLIDIADKFATYADGPEKAALATELFKKGGEALIPLLDEGGAKLRELIDEYKEYSGVSSETAKAADQFNDTIAKIKLISGAFFTQLASALLPTLQKVADIFLEAKASGDGFGGTVGILTTGIKGLMVAGIAVYETFKSLGTAIGAYFAALKDSNEGFLRILSGDFSGGFDAMKRSWSTIKEGFGDVGAQIQTGIKKAADVWNAGVGSMANGTEAAVNNKMRAPIVALNKDLKDATTAFESFMAGLQKQLAGLHEQSEVQKTIIELSQKKYDLITDEQRAAALTTAKEIDDERAYQAEIKNTIKLYEDVQRQLQQIQDEATKALGAYADDNDRLEKEIALIGQSNVVRAQGLATLDAEITRKKLIAAGDTQGLEILDAEIAKRKELIGVQMTAEDNVAQWSSVFQSIDQVASDTFQDIFESGSNAFKKLGDTLKKTLIDVLYQLTVRPFIINLVASVTGQQGIASTMLSGSGAGSPLGFLGSLLGGGGGGAGGLLSTGGSLLSGGGSLLGYGGLSGLFSGAGGIFGSGAIGNSFALGGIGQALGLSAAGLDAGGGVALTALGTTLGTVIPVIGVALAIASMMGAFKHGGPKSGGFAQGGVDLSTGDALQGGFNRYFTPNDSDASLQQPIQQLISDYSNIARSIGVSAGQATFGLGFDTDPKGTAGSRVSAGATVNGVSVYNQHDIDVGRDDQALQDRLTLEAKRALFAALQASDMPEYLGQFFKGVDAATASSDQIDSIIKTAQALKLAVDTFSGLGDKFAALNPDQIKGVIDAFGGIDQFTASFSYLQANFTTSADKMALAQQQLNKSFADLGVAVPKTHQDFLNLVNGIDLTSADGQKLYASLMALAPAFVAVNGSADDAAQKLKELTDNAKDFFQQNFYSDAERAASQLAADTKQIDDAQQQLGISIPRTVDGFRALIEGIDTSTAAGQALYDQLIVLAPAIFDVANASKTAATTIVQAAQAIGTISVDLGSLQQQADTIVSTVMGKITDLAGQKMGDLGDRLGVELSLLPEQITKYQAAASDYYKRYAVVDQVDTEVVRQLKNQQTQLAAQLAAFTTLKAQYGDKAEDLFNLQGWYAQQKQALTGNVQALAALQQIYDEKWKAIIDGTTSGVDGALGALAKLAQGIRDYLASLKIGADSPLSPLAKVQEAASQYQAILAKAQGGDQDALANITKYADSYLQVARQAFASSTSYNQIFDTVYNQLDALANLIDPLTAATTGATGSAGAASTPQSPIDAAAPNDSPIASQNDLAMVKASIEDMNATMTAILQKILASTDTVSSQSVTNTKQITTAVSSRR